MIIVRLNGGLGNQMFQYALGRNLAGILKTQLKLDRSAFRDDPLREYALSPFAIQEDFATDKEVADLVFTRRTLLRRVLDKALQRRPQYASSYIREKSKFHFDPEILNLPDGIYLDGSWQCEKYFASNAPTIRQEFTVKEPLKGDNADMADRISACDAVSLHVRRGDYVSDPKTNRIHGVCDLEYYSRAIEYLVERVSAPRLFVFSDEPDWATEHLHFDIPSQVVGHNPPDQGHEDLRLMALCKHHVIANSSFSWWGAWLCVHISPIVICPSRWFRSQEMDSGELIPERWTKI
ncbi:MAG TPA: alpha-1,2-fucosyltransferase [bacterium]|nr:alpha-1,2-fucosyltransferase [bacterium]